MVMTVVNQTPAREPEVDFKLPSAIRSGQGFWNIDLELQAIKTILTPTSEWSLKVYSSCKLEFFHHSATKSLFVRLHDMMKTADSIDLPSLEFVLSDAQLSPAVKKTLHEAFTGSEEHPAVSIVQSQGDFDVLVNGLSSLAKTRSIYSATQKAALQLRDSDKPSDLVSKITSQLGDSLFSEEAEFLSQLTMGKGYNQEAEDVFNRIVNGYFDERRIKTGFKEFDERTGGFHRTNLVIMSATSGGGKCTIYPTLIPTNQGIMQIGDIYNLFAKPEDKGWIEVPKGNLKIFTREGIEEVSGVFKTEGETYSIQTKWGDEFEGLGEHKLYCYDSEKFEFGFKRLDEISERDWCLKVVGSNLYGENIAIPYEAPVLKKHNKRIENVKKYPQVLTEELAILFGLIVSEGHKGKNFSNKDTCLLKIVQNIILSHFGCLRKIENQTPKRPDYFWIRFNKYLEMYFSHFMGDVKSQERFIPECIMKGPEYLQGAFLRGLYEGDGSIHEMGNTKKGKNTWALQYTTSSKRLVDQLKSMLENMGVYCVIYFYKKTKIYYLHVLKKSYEIFQEKIGFISEKKKVELLKCIGHKIEISQLDIKCLCSSHDTWIPITPILAYLNRVFILMKGQTLEVERSSFGKNTSYVAPVGKFHVFHSCRGSLKWIMKGNVNFISKYMARMLISSHHRYSNIYKNKAIPVSPHIRELVEKDPILREIRSQIQILSSQVWAKVSSVERIKKTVPVFDLSVPGSHEYAANGLMSHNSLMAVNLLKRQYNLGYNTVLASFEMSDEEVMIRLLSNISEVDMNRIQNRSTTPEEMDRITMAWREFNLQGAKAGNHYTILCPKSEVTVPEMGFRIRSLKPDVVILDYINLLNSSMEGESQWQQLGNISKEAKLLANKLNCVVILLAQLDDTYNLRYSKAIKDHANFVFGWVRDETAINSRVIQVKQMKARNAPLYSFDLIERFDIAQFRDPEQDDRRDWPNKDELLSLELECQKIGCKLEPSVSKEFDKKKQEELFQKKRAIIPIEKVSDVINNDLPFPIDEIQFSTLQVKAKSVSLLRSQAGYEDTF